MFQKFYEDTLGSRFIKSLLAQTPIPIYDSVVDGDHIIEGCYYVYRKFIIKCKTSGILKVSSDEQLFPSDKLFPSIFLFVGTGYKAATFYVVAFAQDYSPKTHSVYKSTTNYYDSQTHYYLGRYLRYLNTTEGLNLFPYYNCYNQNLFSDIQLSTKDGTNVDVDRVTKQTAKVIGVPILFGHTYRISIDCSTPVLMRAVIHDDFSYISEDSINSEIADSLRSSSTIPEYMHFKDPVKFRIETANKTAMILERNLYLVIQLPMNNQSSIVISENVELRNTVTCDENSVRKPIILNPSLTALNTQVSYAFSNRLLEYLIGRVIHPGEEISKNITKIQQALSRTSPDYRNSFITKKNTKGIFDKDITRRVFTIMEEKSKSNMIYDQDGNINKDVESFLNLGGLNY